MIKEAVHFPDIFTGFQDRNWGKKVTSLDLLLFPFWPCQDPTPRFQTRLREPGVGLGGGEGAKLGDIYPTTFGELFEGAEQRRGSFALAFRTASGLLSSPPSRARRRLKIQIAATRKPRSPPEGCLRGSAAYSIRARAALRAARHDGG